MNKQILTLSTLTILSFSTWVLAAEPTIENSALSDTTKETGLDSTQESIAKPVMHKINYDAMMVRKVSSLKADGHAVSGGNIYFEVDKAIVVPTEHIKIEEIVKAIERLKDKIDKIVIEGIASRDGDPKRNFTLGIERAKAVKQALVELNVPESLIETISYGEESSYHFKNLNKNRRAQIKIYVK